MRWFFKRQSTEDDAARLFRLVQEVPKKVRH
jgi:hypothetical protein